MSAPDAVRAPADFEERLRSYYFERSEEERAVRVGEKETSEQAAIVARYADLFSRPQLEALGAAAEAADGGDRERLARLQLTCEAGLVDAELTAREDALENATLAARVMWEGEELPLRTAQARLATLLEYGERDELGARALAVSSGFNEERRSLLAARNGLEAELSGEAARGRPQRARQGHLAPRSGSRAARDRAYDGGCMGTVARAVAGQPARWERDEIPSVFHVSWMRRLSPLADTYSKERSVPVCTASLHAIGFAIEDDSRIRLDLEDRPRSRRVHA